MDLKISILKIDEQSTPKVHPITRQLVRDFCKSTYNFYHDYSSHEDSLVATTSLDSISFHIISFLEKKLSNHYGEFELNDYGITEIVQIIPNNFSLTRTFKNLELSNLSNYFNSLEFYFFEISQKERDYICKRINSYNNQKIIGVPLLNFDLKKKPQK